MPLYLEDLVPGFTVTGGPITVTEAEAIHFARQFDPQPFHTDPIAAKTSVFDGLAVSGWHTAALSMRLLTQSRLAEVANGLVGVEIRNLRWPRATRPGDTLRVTVEIVETKPSRSRPGWGTALARWTTRNQRDETVMELENIMWVARRPDA
ncbi:MAG: MaoC family dehydratase [Gammaproteobacteria bacterium]|nr:MaoC family dehydratase [Gammaproteobacteria bacterium]